MSRRAQAWIVLLAAAGLLASGVATYVHARILLDPGYTTFCDVSATVNCTQVYQSPYGSVAGVPVAFPGVVWFGGVLLLTWARPRGDGPSEADLAGYLVAWSTAGLAVAMYLAYAALFVLGSFCPLCGVVYGAVIGIFLLADSGSATPLRLLPRALVRDAGRMVRQPARLAAGLTLAGVTLASGVWLAQLEADPLDLEQTLHSNTARLAEFDQWWAGQARVALPFAVPDAPVVVVKFTDYQCPACAQAHGAYQPVLDQYAATHADAVQMLTMDFPLDPSCNEHAPGGQHEAACAAAAAVRLAREVGAAEAAALEDWLYGNQASLSAETVAAAARDIAGVEDFEAGYAAAIDAVQADVAAAAALPVEVTPTFVINGVVLRGGLPPELFDRAIANELAR